MDAILDVLHRRRPIYLIVPAEHAVYEFDVTNIPSAAILEYGHQSGTPGAKEGFVDGPEIDIKIAVTVHHEKLLSEQMQRMAQCAACAERLGTIAHIPHATSKRSAITDIRLNLLAEVPNADHDIGNSVTRQQAKLMRDEGAPRDLDHRFRHSGRDWPQPGCQTTSQQGKWRHLHKYACCGLHRSTPPGNRVGHHGYCAGMSS